MLGYFMINSQLTGYGIQWCVLWACSGMWTFAYLTISKSADVLSMTILIIHSLLSTTISEHPAHIYTCNVYPDVSVLPMVYNNTDFSSNN